MSAAFAACAVAVFLGRGHVAGAGDTVTVRLGLSRTALAGAACAADPFIDGTCALGAAGAPLVPWPPAEEVLYPVLLSDGAVLLVRDAPAVPVVRSRFAEPTGNEPFTVECRATLGRRVRDVAMRFDAKTPLESQRFAWIATLAACELR
ncbi:MAG TPA: hypothetical protein VHE30_09905 [Polyangiaceae bacterium]|nr:hypothetical protein [Polyangiaceae bacterium]